MKKTLYDFNDAHKGETIYVLGSSPSLNNLGQKEKEYLKDKVTIGVNLTCEALPSLKYVISAHIVNAVYAFEFFKKDVPVFVDYGSPRKVQAFSYMEDFFWNDDRIVKFLSSPPRLPLFKKNNLNDSALNGNTSILLLATHLAYIMGASKIVYMGFEELICAHYWNDNRELENKIKKNIESILESKKYFSKIFYDNAPHCIPFNVHKEFELIIGKVKPEVSYFDLSEEEYNKPFITASCTKNIKNFQQYVKFLNESGIETETLSTDGITIQAGCVSTSLVGE